MSRESHDVAYINDAIHDIQERGELFALTKPRKGAALLREYSLNVMALPLQKDHRGKKKSGTGGGKQTEYFVSVDGQRQRFYFAVAEDMNGNFAISVEPLVIH